MSRKRTWALPEQRNITSSLAFVLTYQACKHLSRPLHLPRTAPEKVVPLTALRIEPLLKKPTQNQKVHQQQQQEEAGRNHQSQDTYRQVNEQS